MKPVLQALTAGTTGTFLLLASGCATNGAGGADKPISMQQQAAIRTVSIVPSVSIPAYPAVYGPTAQGAGWLLGQAVAGSESDEAREYRSLLETHGIAVGDMVREEFESRLTRSNAYAQVGAEDSDGRFGLTIERYGLDPAPGFSAFNYQLRPTMRLSARLVNRAGELVWQKSAYMTALNESITSATYDKILDDPEWSREGFKLVAQRLVTEILQDLVAYPTAAGTTPAGPQQTGPASTRWIPPATAATSKGASPGLPAAGTTWTYGYLEKIFGRRQVELSVRVLGVDGSVVEEVVTPVGASGGAARRAIDAAESRFTLYPLGSSASVMEFSPYLLAASASNAPSVIGDPAGYPEGSPGLPSWIAKATVRGWEQVVVPAGKFKALRVDVAGRRSAPIGGRTTAAGRFTMRAWYAPDVKRIVRLEHRVWTADDLSPSIAADEVFVLIAYRPAP